MKKSLPCMPVFLLNGSLRTRLPKAAGLDFGWIAKKAGFAILSLLPIVAAGGKVQDPDFRETQEGKVAAHKARTVDQQAETAWGVLTGRLFSARTNLIYDSVCNISSDGQFQHLPSADDISRCLPDRRGWGSGMEDSMLNAGSAIDAAVIRAKMQKKGGSAFASRLLSGMELCAAVHGKKGYVVRSVSPIDGKSCYPEASIDQFTFWTWGLWRYYRSGLASAQEKARIRRLLVNLAEYCDELLKKNENSLRSLDGRWNPMAQIVKIRHPHTGMRLPMFYAAAYSVTGDARWLKQYQRYYAENEKITFYTKPSQAWNFFSLPQHQTSLRLCWEVDPDAEHKKLFRQEMEKLADIAAGMYRKWVCFRAISIKKWNVPAVSWRKKEVRQQRKDKDGRSEFSLKPQKEFYEAFDSLRCCGNAMITMMLCPSFRLTEKDIDLWKEVMTTPDFASHTSAGIVNILHGHYLYLERRQP